MMSPTPLTTLSHNILIFTLLLGSISLCRGLERSGGRILLHYDTIRGNKQVNLRPEFLLPAQVHTRSLCLSYENEKKGL